MQEDINLGVAGFIDVETTGLSLYEDEIIEFGIVTFSYNKNTGEIVNILDEYVGLRDPNKKIKKEAFKINGIHEHELKGKQLDFERINDLIKNVDFLVSHNVNFDKFFCDKTIKNDIPITWYCSMMGIPWREYGFKSKGLQNLLTDHNIIAKVSHRAIEDIKSAIKLLSQKNKNNEYYFKILISGRPYWSKETERETAASCASEINKYNKFTFKCEFDKAIHTLEGIIKGIALDKIINQEEILELIHWCTLNRRFINVNPFKELIPLIEESLEDKNLSREEKEDILWVCNNVKSGNKYYDVITSDIQRLQGLLHGILSDNKINEDELIGLKNWLNENEHLANTYPYDEVYSLVLSVLSDNRMDEEEKKVLRIFFTDFIDTQSSFNINKNEIDNLKSEINVSGICSICPEIIFKNNCFCFTGASTTIRSESVNIINSLGGIYNDRVTKSTNYLIIGDLGNSCWAFACYGRKVEKAMKYRKEGQTILIVHENDFWDAVKDLK